MEEWNEINFNDLKGKTIKTITGLCKDSEEAIFICTDGTKYRMNHYQSCCENVYIEDIYGDVEDLIGSEILVAEEIKGANIPPKKESHDSYTWTFYKIATAKGSVDIRWYGVSNGYYSESVSFEKCKTTFDSIRPKSTIQARDSFRFRVWDKEQGSYHYDAEDTCYYEYGSLVIPLRQSICLIDEDNYVLEQCTGLKDKKGTLIYEGDIVKMNADIMCADMYQQDKPCYVEFGKMGFWFVYPQLDNKHKSAGWNECAEYEIIGNIHENPELLEK